MKIIGLDVGTKRIGVAKVDTSVKITVPEETVLVDGTELAQIRQLGARLQTNLFVLGLPRNSAGLETAQSKYVRDFAIRLQEAIPDAKIRFQDESLTSVEAEQRLSQRKKPFAKGAIDAEAATIILQDFVESQTQTSSHNQTSVQPQAKDNSDLTALPESQNLEKDQENAKKKPKSAKFSIFKRILLAFAAILALAAFLGFNWYHTSLQPVVAPVDCQEAPKSDHCQTVKFTVPESASAGQIGQQLAKAGLIRNPLTFQAYVRLGGYVLKSGTYQLSKTMSAQQIIELLSSNTASAEVFRLTFLPGETLASIKTKIIAQGYTKTEVDQVFAKKLSHPVLASLPADASLEGYIYGDTYEFFKGETVSNIIKRTLDQLHQVIKKEDLANQFSQQGLTLHQGIILASIVQKEAKSPDQPAVARVFLNRLKAGMNLGSDVTVQYALDLKDPNRQIYTDNASSLKIDSCYNTRIHAGLPCGPISNPGLSALQAVAHPAQNDYLYFLTGDDGKMYYSMDDAGHQRNITNHCRQLCGVSL